MFTVSVYIERVIITPQFQKDVCDINPFILIIPLPSKIEVHPDFILIGGDMIKTQDIKKISFYSLSNPDDQIISDIGDYIVKTLSEQDLMHIEIHLWFNNPYSNIHTIINGKSFKYEYNEGIPKNEKPSTNLPLI
jgi:hypothetical protein